MGIFSVVLLCAVVLGIVWYLRFDHKKAQLAKEQIAQFVGEQAEREARLAREQEETVNQVAQERQAPAKQQAWEWGQEQNRQLKALIEKHATLQAWAEELAAKHQQIIQRHLDAFALGDNQRHAVRNCVNEIATPESIVPTRHIAADKGIASTDYFAQWLLAPLTESIALPFAHQEAQLLKEREEQRAREHNEEEEQWARAREREKQRMQEQLEKEERLRKEHAQQAERAAQRAAQELNMKLATLKHNYAALIAKFYEVAERKVSLRDEYGEEQWDALGGEVSVVMKKIALREGFIIPTYREWEKGLPNRLPCEYNRLRDFLNDSFKERHAKAQAQPIERPDFTAMTGEDFEIYLMKLLDRLGYTDICGTATTGDQGADILAKKDGRTIVIQAKNYNGPVGNSAVQEVTAAVHFYSGDEGWVITNSTFTPSAIALAQKAGVRLIDGHELRRLAGQTAAAIA